MKISKDAGENSRYSIDAAFMTEYKQQNRRIVGEYTREIVESLKKYLNAQVGVH